VKPTHCFSPPFTTLPFFFFPSRTQLWHGPPFRDHQSVLSKTFIPPPPPQIAISRRPPAQHHGVFFYLCSVPSHTRFWFWSFFWAGRILLLKSRTRAQHLFVLTFFFRLGPVLHLLGRFFFLIYLGSSVLWLRRWMIPIDLSWGLFYKCSTSDTWGLSGFLIGFLFQLSSQTPIFRSKSTPMRPDLTDSYFLLFF